jgi:hypothetical protein
MLRTCKKCKSEKELNNQNFKPNGGKRFTWICRVCINNARHVENLSEEQIEHTRLLSRNSWRKHRKQRLIDAKNYRDSHIEEIAKTKNRCYQRRKEYYDEQNKKWALDNPERVKQIKNKYRELNREMINEKSKTSYVSGSHRINHLKNKYNITEEDYQRLLEKQKGKCCICETIYVPTKRFPQLSVDHNHNTGKVRGLLCHKHNLGLGYFSDDVNQLGLAIGYLNENK